MILCYFFLSIPARKKALEQLWILGDEFSDKSVGEHLIRADIEDTYMTYNFEVWSWAGNYNSNSQSILGRMRNALVQAFNSQQTIPKWIVVVFEKDMIERYQFDPHTASRDYYKQLEWLMTELNQEKHAW